MQNGSGRRGISFTSLLAVVCALSIGSMLVLQSIEVRRLRPQAAELKRRKALPYIGQWVPTIRAPSISGDLATLGETSMGRTQVLFFFNVTCPYCTQNLPMWKAITDSLRHDPGTAVYWVSLSPLDSTIDYLAANAINAKVVRFPDEKSQMVYREDRGTVARAAGHLGASATRRIQIFRVASAVRHKSLPASATR